jgi:hypothetical protein
MATTPRDRWYRRAWGYTNRPYLGCAFIYPFLVILLLWVILWWVVPFFFAR